MINKENEMKLTTAIKNQAQRTVTLKSASQVSEYLGNLAYRIAFATLNEIGWYSCKIEGSKTLFVIA